MKKFLLEIKENIYGPGYYKNIKNETTGAAIKYYAKLALLLAVIASLVTSIISIPLMWKGMSPESMKEKIKLFPEELTVTLKNGEFSTNVREPYAIPINSEWTRGDIKQPKNLIVIDTSKSEFSSDVLEKYDTVIFLSKDSIVMEKNGGFQVVPIAKEFKEETLEINRAFIEAKMSKVLPIIKNLLWFLPIIFAFGWFVIIFGKLVPFLLYAVVIWMALYFLKQENGYGHAFRVTVHAMTFGVILSLLFPQQVNFLVFLLISLAVVLLNFRQADPLLPVQN